jgi:hypothetical protein
MEYTNTPFEQLMEGNVQRGTIEERDTIASKASRNAKHDSKEFPRIVPPSERSACAVSVLFLMYASYRYDIPPPKSNYCHYFFVNNFGKSDFGAYFACHLVVN